MRQEVDETREVARLELWRRASRKGDLEAWAAFQQDLEGTVLAWFHAHPSSEAASRVQSESHFVARAFEQVWHLVVQRQVACQELSEALVYLRASLNGAILEELRVARREGSASSLPDRQEPSESGAVWGKLQAALSNERERRLAYLLYHCGLRPAEIARLDPQEWSDVQQVMRLRAFILRRLLAELPLIAAEADQISLR
jgi:integrase